MLKKEQQQQQQQQKKIPASFGRMRCVTLFWSRAYVTRFWLAKCGTAIDRVRQTKKRGHLW